MTYAEAIEEIERALLYNGVQNPLTDRAIEKIKELVNEREHKEDVECWPDWKKRAALCNYEFGKEDA